MRPGHRCEGLNEAIVLEDAFWLRAGKPQYLTILLAHRWRPVADRFEWMPAISTNLTMRLFKESYVEDLRGMSVSVGRVIAPCLPVAVGNQAIWAVTLYDFHWLQYAWNLSYCLDSLSPTLSLPLYISLPSYITLPLYIPPSLYLSPSLSISPSPYP